MLVNINISVLWGVTRFRVESTLKIEAAVFSEMETTIFWDIMPRNPLKVNLCFGGTYRLHFQSRINRTI
jgi:hypothetical protein